LVLRLGLVRPSFVLSAVRRVLNCAAPIRTKDYGPSTDLGLRTKGRTKNEAPRTKD